MNSDSVLAPKLRKPVSLAMYTTSGRHSTENSQLGKAGIWIAQNPQTPDLTITRRPPVLLAPHQSNSVIKHQKPP